MKYTIDNFIAKINSIPHQDRYGHCYSVTKDAYECLANQYDNIAIVLGCWAGKGHEGGIHFVLRVDRLYYDFTQKKVKIASTPEGVDCLASKEVEYDNMMTEAKKLVNKIDEAVGW